MVENNQESSGRTLHDRLFKEFLRRFLPDFMRLFFPAEAARLDFSTLAFLDQELLVNLPGQTLRITDVVAEVAASNGELETVIVHLEVEGRDRRSLPQRMFEYYGLLRLLRQKRVLPIALVLLPQSGGLAWQTYQETLFERTLVEFHYGQVALRDLTSEDYLGESPVAAALAALMRPSHLHPAELKLFSLRTVVESDLTEGDKLFLIDIIEVYLPREKLPNAGDEIMQALLETELTWGERRELEGKLKGQLEGEIKGRLAVLQHQMRIKFGRLPQAFIRQLEAINDPDALDELSEQILTAVTLDDIILPE